VASRLLRFLRERVPDVYVVLITAFDDMPTVVSAMREGAFDFLIEVWPWLVPARSSFVTAIVFVSGN